MEKCIVKNVKKGEFVRLSDKQNAKTYTRGEYCRSSKKYMLHDESDISAAIFVKAERAVFIGFEY